MITSFAFLLVAASTLAMIPIMLYIFRLEAHGWQWQHAALFSASIASTDAVAVSAILKKGSPRHPIPFHSIPFLSFLFHFFVNLPSCPLPPPLFPPLPLSPSLPALALLLLSLLSNKQSSFHVEAMREWEGPAALASELLGVGSLSTFAGVLVARRSWREGCHCEQ